MQTNVGFGLDIFLSIFALLRWGDHRSTIAALQQLALCLIHSFLHIILVSQRCRDPLRRRCRLAAFAKDGVALWCQTYLYFDGGQ